MRIDVWSDLVCPWCYIGKRRLEHALSAFEHKASVDVVHRAFQLHPDMPRGSATSRREMLKSKYRLSDDQVQTMDERLERLAAEDGLDYDLSGGDTGNTLDAHRLSHHARTLGKQDALVERLFRAYFTEQRSIFDHAALVELSREAGLEPEESRQVLESRQYTENVEADQSEATLLGARGVPLFVIDGRFGVSGAQPIEAFTEALERAWQGSSR